MAFCIAVQQHLSVSTCPLPKGQCYWQHKRTLNCCYTPDELTEEEFCERTGTPLEEVPDQEARELILSKIKDALRG